MAAGGGVEAGDVIGGRYRLARPLGEGGMGVVYEAVQEPLGRRVALKLLRRELAEDVSFAARFRREAELAASLGHPNIAQVTDFGVDDGRPFLVMDLLVGEPLAALLAREGRLSERRAAFIASQMLDALAAAHARGVVHRDLKPENVFLSHISGVADVVRLLDFGIAHADDDSRMTRTGQVLGTPAYMSPEQARGRDVDESTDLYAVGVCLYEMVSGTLPYVGSNYNELIFAIVGEEAPPLAERAPDVSAEFCALVERAMAKEKHSRFGGAAEMREALAPFARAGQLEVSPVPAAGEKVRSAESFAPTVTPAPTPAERAAKTPEAFAPTITPATEPPRAAAPSAEAFAPTITPATEPPAAPASVGASGSNWRRMLWMLPGFALAALFMILGRFSADTSEGRGPAEVSAPVAAAPATSGSASASDGPGAASVSAGGAVVARAGDDVVRVAAGDASAPADGAAPTDAALDSATRPELQPGAEPSRRARSADAPRRRRPATPRTRTVMCGGRPREVEVLRSGEGVRASFMQTNNLIGLDDFRPQVHAREADYARCYRGHSLVPGRIWLLSVDASGVVRDATTNDYCDIDPEVRACMRSLWRGQHLDGFGDTAGTVRIGIGIAGR